jgi:hypothetical protein
VLTLPRSATSNRSNHHLPRRITNLDLYKSINAVIESFWARMQVELLNRKEWKTRIELANAIFEYLEIFHNRQRRHSALGMLTPVEYEIESPAPYNDNKSSKLTPRNHGHTRASTKPGAIQSDLNATITPAA